MPTWLSLHLRTRRTEEAVRLLAKLSNTKLERVGAFPSETEFRRQLKLGLRREEPDWLVVSPTSADWLTVRHACCKILDDWLEKLSKQLSCTAVQIQGQSVSEAYTLIVAEKGSLTRLLQVCHEDDDHEPIDDGQPEDFEALHPFVASDFDLAWISRYVAHLGLDLDAGHDRTDWRVLSRPTATAAVSAKKKSAAKKPRKTAM